MGSNTTTFKATDFSYPSKEEREDAVKNYPSLSIFGFTYKSEIVSFSEGNTLEEITKNSSLYYWDQCLQNKLGKLYLSYVNTFTHDQRGIHDDNGLSKLTEENHLNRIQFSFYAETFYYFFFSVRDIIAQILNVYYSVESEEHKVKFGKDFIKKINDVEVADVLKSFSRNSEKAADIRNGFTHRFPINQPDYRPSFKNENGQKVLSAGTGDYTPAVKIIENINEALTHLSVLLEALQEKIK